MHLEGLFAYKIERIVKISFSSRCYFSRITAEEKLNRVHFKEKKVLFLFCLFQKKASECVEEVQSRMMDDFL